MGKQLAGQIKQQMAEQLADLIIRESKVTMPEQYIFGKQKTGCSGWHSIRPALSLKYTAFILGSPDPIKTSNVTFYSVVQNEKLQYSTSATTLSFKPQCTLKPNDWSAPLHRLLSILPRLAEQ